jgi:hypothetical protein
MANKKWYMGWDLKDRWDISEDDLLQYLLDGELIAYPDIVSEPFSKDDIIDFIRGYNETPWAYDETSGPWSLRFRSDNVLEFEKLHDINVWHDKDKKN